MTITKAQLIELLKDISDETDVTENLKEIEGVSEIKEIPFDSSKLTVDDYKAILENNKVIQGYNKSQMDSAISKGVESFKTKKMPAIIQEEIKKAMAPQGETEEQKQAREKQEELEARLAEMEEKNAANEAKLAKESRIKEVRDYLTEKKYPKQMEKFIEYIVGEDIDESKKTTDSLANAFSEYGQQVLNTDMQNNPFNPSAGGNGGEPINPIQAEVNQILGL